MHYYFEENKIYLFNKNGEKLGEVSFPEQNSGVVEISKFIKVNSDDNVTNRLFKAMYNQIKNNNYKATTSCPHVYNWFQKNPKFKDILI